MSLCQLSNFFHKKVTCNLSVDHQNVQESYHFDSDCLVLKLSSTNGKGKVVKYPQKAPNKSFFPKTVVTTIKGRINSLERLHSDNDHGLNQSQFILISETFLQMYNNIFRCLHECVSFDPKK